MAVEELGAGAGLLVPLPGLVIWPTAACISRRAALAMEWRRNSWLSAAAAAAVVLGRGVGVVGSASLLAASSQPAEARLPRLFRLMPLSTPALPLLLLLWRRSTLDER